LALHLAEKLTPVLQLRRFLYNTLKACANMTSPYRISDRSRSRSLLNGHRHSLGSSHGNTEGHLSKHYEDLSLQYVEQDRAFELQLAEGTHRRESMQKQALETAAKAHKAVLDHAMMDLELIEIEAERKRLRIEAEKNRMAAEAKRKLDEERASELRRLQAERERDEARKQEAVKVERERQEAQQRAAAEQKERDEQAKRAQQQKEKDAADAQAAEQQKQTQLQEQARLQAQQKQAVPTPQVSQPAAVTPAAAVTGATSHRDDLEKTHATFLAMKQALKQTRDRLDQAKSQDAWLKQNLGEKCRRRIKTLVNQVNKHNKEENRRVVSEGLSESATTKVALLMTY
jgi:nucleoporin GLE1